MKNYQEYNSTTFPLTVKGSYYIESYKCETTLFMTGVALSWIVILVATLVILTRWKKVFEARDISLFLPFSVRMFLTNDPVNNPSQFEGMKISYKDLHFKDFSGTTHLNESSGEFLPYTLTALLGESGSGKTTFINTLSRRSGQGTMGGKVMIGGNSLNSESMKRLIGFVPQDDTMIPILTPKETLLFNSFVRNPDLTWSGHKERVDGILKDLKLIKKNSDVSNTIIGDEQKRGISGGEKKRVNVGIELVTQPPVLILDEPTTGLDYLTANKLVKILLGIAKGGKTVICVIHQPAYETFSLFTDVMVFKSKHVVLKGKREIISHEIGFNQLKLNRYANADEILDFTSNSSFESLFEIQTRVESKSIVRKTDSNEEKQLVAKEVSPFFKQFLAVFIRAVIQIYREWFSLFVDACLNLIGGLLIGILFINVRGDLFQGPLSKTLVYQCPTEKMSICSLPQRDQVNALSSYLILGVSLACAMSSLRIFGKERSNFIRETLSGVNSLVYFTVKVLLSVIQMVTVSFCFTLTFYFIVSPRASFGMYFALFMLIAIVTFPVAYCVSILVRPELRQITCATIVFVAYIFCGATPTLTSVNEMPNPLPMFPFLSHARYLRELLYIAEVTEYQKDYEIVKSFSLFSYQYDHWGYLLLNSLFFSVLYQLVAYVMLWQSSPTSALNKSWAWVKSFASRIVKPIKNLIAGIGFHLQSGLQEKLGK